LVGRVEAGEQPWKEGHKDHEADDEQSSEQNVPFGTVALAGGIEGVNAAAKQPGRG